MDEDSEIVKVEMQDVYPRQDCQQPAEMIFDERLDDGSNSTTGRRVMAECNGGNRYDNVLSTITTTSQDPIEQQRVAAFMDRIKQLYYLDDDPTRKEFLDEYFEFMRKRDSPVSRIPTMAKQPLDLYKLFKTVTALGGLTEVVKNRQWSKVTRELNLPTSITSAAFTLRTQYLRFLYAYECAQKGIECTQWKYDDSEDSDPATFRATQASPTAFGERRACHTSPENGSDQRYAVRSPPPHWSNDHRVYLVPQGPYSQLPPGSQPRPEMHPGDKRPYGMPVSEIPHHFHANHTRQHSPTVSNHIPAPKPVEPAVSVSTRHENNEDHQRTKVDDGRSSSSSKSSSHENQESANGSKDRSHSSSGSKGAMSPTETSCQGMTIHSSATTSDMIVENNGSSKMTVPAPLSMHGPIPTEPPRGAGAPPGSFPPEMPRQACPCGRCEEQGMRDHVAQSLHSPNVRPPPYARAPFFPQRKRPRFYGPSDRFDGPRGACGCGRGEILESSEPTVFKVHYRTEQRAFVTLQFGRRLYLGELFAEELE